MKTSTKVYNSDVQRTAEKFLRLISEQCVAYKSNRTEKKRKDKARNLKINRLNAPSPCLMSKTEKIGIFKKKGLNRAKQHLRTAKG